MLLNVISWNTAHTDVQLTTPRQRMHVLIICQWHTESGLCFFYHPFVRPLTPLTVKEIVVVRANTRIAMQILGPGSGAVRVVSSRVVLALLRGRQRQFTVDVQKIAVFFLVATLPQLEVPAWLR
jgi:hypothetical protein